MEWFRAFFQTQSVLDAEVEIEAKITLVDEEHAINEAPSKNPESEEPTSIEARIYHITGSGKRLVARCGHLSLEHHCFYVFGEEITSKQGECCSKCGTEQLKRSVFQCAVCGLPIKPGDPVVEYHSSEVASLPGREIPFSWTEGDTTLGCFRPGCCPKGTLRSGHWLGEQGYSPLHVV